MEYNFFVRQDNNFGLGTGRNSIQSTYFETRAKIENEKLTLNFYNSSGLFKKNITKFGTGKEELNIKEVKSVSFGYGFLLGVGNIIAITFVFLFFIYYISIHFSEIINYDISKDAIVSPMLGAIVLLYVVYVLITSLIFEYIKIEKKDRSKYYFPVYKYRTMFRLGNEKNIKDFLNDLLKVNPDININQIAHNLKNAMKLLRIVFLVGLFLVLQSGMLRQFIQ